MKYKLTKRVKIAVVLLVIMSYNIVAPSVAYALTSGPAEPETKGFQPAGVSDMVDLQTGDFKYNIPLLDIDGYPINLNYASGVGMDDEASWVGLGWSLNPGAINRQVRGIPDDYAGDMVETDHWTKPKVTVGGKATAKFEEFGAIGVNGSFSLGIFSDNYTGIGAEIGVNGGMSFNFANSGCMTAALGAGITSNTQSGVDVTPYANLSIKENSTQNWTESAGLSASLGYNSRSGLKSLSLGSTFSINGHDDENDSQGSGNYDPYGSTISYNTEPLSPSSQLPYYSSYESFSFDVGLAGLGGFSSVGGMGYKSVRQVASYKNFKPAYGFLYAERGKDNPSAQMDFIREKDNPIIKGIPNIAIPIHTPDLWSYTSQSGSGQFRLYRGGSGIFFDSEADDQSDNNSIGGDLGVGDILHGGYTQFSQGTNNITRKWKTDNAYLAKGDFQNQVTTDPKQQHAYFRQIGEKNQEDEENNANLLGTSAMEVQTNSMSANNVLQTAGNPAGTTISSAIAKTKTKRNNRTQISYLTAKEASLPHGALEKHILRYDFNYYDPGTPFVPPANNKPIPIDSLSRTDANHKGNHISEITIADEGGKRMVYGIPVYNTLQTETTFAVSPPPKSGLVTYDGTGQTAVPPDVLSPAHGVEGVDNYYYQEKKPAYATSFLLTAILSPDYVDKTGNGISDDDLGTAIKFNYSKLKCEDANGVPHNYRWRAPYENATLNKGLLADPDDDKGSVIYGEKEIWYVSSIETKTKVVYFITEDRLDGLGVQSGWQKGGKDNSQTQKCLKEIRLYSKADMTTPIKVVKFQYDYCLCPGIPNFYNSGNDPENLNATAGKLTLKSVWFEYGNSHKGSNHKYTFNYNTHSITNNNTGYNYMSTDRWGTYKDHNLENPVDALTGQPIDNEHYPYSDQSPSTNNNAGLWHLKQVNLPTGGTINVSYEPGDYAYVQDKKAMVMTNFKSLISDGAGTQTTNLGQAVGISMNLSATDITNANTTTDKLTWFKNYYLDGSDYLYTKLYVNFKTDNDSEANTDQTSHTEQSDRWWDYVPCYAKVTGVSIDPKNSCAYVTFESVTDGGVTKVNPIAIAAWQKLKNEYPRYAYPGYDNRLASADGSVAGAVTAIVDAAKNLSELLEKFYTKAQNKSYCAQVDLSNSFIRITKLDGKKYGGNARVSKVAICDDWGAMTSGPASATHTYGQAYTYTTTTTDATGQPQTISSGVASYEPSIGNDENPLRQPVQYVQTVAGGINNYFDLEEPFGESLFPAPQVVYSKVTVQDLDHTFMASTSTGYTVNECYTAKDFPVKVTVLPIISNSYQPISHYSLISTNSIDELSLSQGYSIELNDMHGKPKAVTVYNQAGSVISSVVYYYNAVDNGGSMSLNNQVNVIDQTGHQCLKYLGRDIEFFTDFREQQSNNQGQAINIGGDIFYVPVPPLAFGLPHVPINDNNEFNLFRSACGLKVIQDYGIMSKVVKTENGSTITTENLAYDKVTGDPIVTRTQNEFNKNIYTVNLPAYWVYNNMGGAYKTSDVIISDLPTDQNGIITNATYSSFFTPGDELLDLHSGERYWVGKAAPTTTCDQCDFSTEVSGGTPPGGGTTSSGQYFLMDRNGAVVPNLNNAGPVDTVKVVRSGFRNMLNAQTTSIVSLNNPIVNNQLQLTLNTDLTQLKVINASASTYKGLWGLKPDCSNDHKTEDKTTLAQPDGSDDFILQKTVSNANYAAAGIRTFTGTDDQSGGAYTNADAGNNTLRGRFNISAIWVGNADDSSTLGDEVGFDTYFTVPQDGPYYIGYSGDDTFNYSIDGVALPQPSVGGNNAVWYVCYMPLSASQNGIPIQHHLMASGTNNDDPGNNTLAINPGALALEVYNFDPTAFSNAIYTVGGNVVFSTSSLVPPVTTPALPPLDIQTYVKKSINGGPVTQYNRFTYNYCVNPYVDGFFGNWRPSQSMVYQQSRNYSSNLFAPGNPGIDVKDSGYINNFYSYWYYGTGQWTPNPNGFRWTAANTVTLYDKYGQQLENKDALGRYSAANFSFNGELPSTVASNAMNREIYSNGFEDLLFNPGTVTQTCYPVDINQLQTISLYNISPLSHSGNYSISLPSTGIDIGTNAYTAPPTPSNLLVRGNFGEYNVQKDNITQKDVIGIYPNGFEPVNGKPYLFDVWVNDAQPTNKTINISLAVNGNTVNLTCRAVVEGWKLLEAKIDPSLMTSGALDFKISPNGNGGTIYIDDLRIHPYDSEMKTYVYDDKTLRLMAELDENCFATFYEYDDEGLLVRVKKETEKGIMTLKESRSSYKKVTP